MEALTFSSNTHPAHPAFILLRVAYTPRVKLRGLKVEKPEGCLTCICLINAMHPK
jgi:hypothetical protein